MADVTRVVEVVATVEDRLDEGRESLLDLSRSVLIKSRRIDRYRLAFEQPLLRCQLQHQPEHFLMHF